MNTKGGISETKTICHVVSKKKTICHVLSVSAIFFCQVLCLHGNRLERAAHGKASAPIVSIHVTEKKWKNPKHTFPPRTHTPVHSTPWQCTATQVEVPHPSLLPPHSCSQAFTPDFSVLSAALHHHQAAVSSAQLVSDAVLGRSRARGSHQSSSPAVLYLSGNAPAAAARAPAHPLPPPLLLRLPPPPSPP
jgi:hypothetical protein